MTKMGKARTVLKCIGIMVVLFFLIAGCAGSKGKKKSSTPQVTKQQDTGPSPSYYDFGDVLIPSELKMDKKTSFVFRTSSFSAGVLSLKGRVEVNSLIDFFNNNMVKDNWREVASFKSHRSVMLYQKENRWCVINIKENDFNTHVEIWVAPTINEFESELLK